MDKKHVSINSTSSLSSHVSVAENLKDFPDLAKKITLCYATIADLLEVLDDRSRLDETTFSIIEKYMKLNIATLYEYLVDVFPNPIELDRLYSMEQYYYEVRGDAMEYLIDQIDASSYDINVRLQSMFDDLSTCIVDLEREPHSREYLYSFYVSMSAIKQLLESFDYTQQMTLLQYHNRGKKYISAYAYLQKIRSNN